MGKVRFISYRELCRQYEPMKWDYRVDDAPYDVNLSGDYYPAADYEALVKELRGSHCLECNSPTQHIGGPGCVCKTINKHDYEALEVELARMRKVIKNKDRLIAEFIDKLNCILDIKDTSDEK